MKKQIRLGTFETNSSSAHSLVINSVNSKINKKIEMENNNIELFLDEYYWRVNFLETPSEKLAYLLTLLCLTEYIDTQKELEENETFQKWCMDLKKHIEFENILCTGFETCNVDHESLRHPEVFIEDIESNNEYSSFAKAIFDDNIVFEISNDNTDCDYELKLDFFENLDLSEKQLKLLPLDKDNNLVVEDEDISCSTILKTPQEKFKLILELICADAKIVLKKEMEESLLFKKIIEEIKTLYTNEKLKIKDVIFNKRQISLFEYYIVDYYEEKENKQLKILHNLMEEYRDKFITNENLLAKIIFNENVVILIKKIYETYD